MFSRLVTVIGARPQFIKAAMVSKALIAEGGCSEAVIHTGQHYDFAMSSVFFEELGIPSPRFQLSVGSGSHGCQTGRMLEAVESVLVTERPDIVLVYGDTNSTLAGALAAAKLCIPVAHVEAGLRSHNRHMPEELNRILTDHTAELLFAPTQHAVENLRREGIHGEKVFQVGDVMYDAAIYYGDRAMKESSVLRRLGLTPRCYVLSTVHRAENTDDLDRLRSIFDALRSVARHLTVVLPLHPRTRNALERGGLLESSLAGLTVVDPVGYLDMVCLERSARLVATDSGGIQKEAFFHKVPCVTLRTETEWTELVELGWNQLAHPGDADRVFQAIMNGLDRAGREGAPYGQGDSASMIARELLLWLAKK